MKGENIMLNLVFENGQEIKEKEANFLVTNLDGQIFEADDFRELTAAVCGREYLDCECAETELHMRIKQAKMLGLMIMTEEEENRRLNVDLVGPDVDLTEPIIVYDERIGKIPYSYTDPIVDYDIHGEPELIRVECDESFILSLELANMVVVFEKENGKYLRITGTREIEEELERHVERFRRLNGERVPLHKKLGE